MDISRTTQDGHRSHGTHPQIEGTETGLQSKCFNCRDEGHISINCPSECAMLCEGAAPDFNNCQTRGKAEDRAGVQTLTEVYSLHKISALWAF